MSHKANVYSKVSLLFWGTGRKNEKGKDTSMIWYNSSIYISPCFHNIDNLIISNNSNSWDGFCNQKTIPIQVKWQKEECYLVLLNFFFLHFWKTKVTSVRVNLSIPQLIHRTSCFSTQAQMLDKPTHQGWERCAHIDCATLGIQNDLIYFPKME